MSVTSLLPLLQRAYAGERVEGLPMELPPPIARTIGFQPGAIERGAATFWLDVRRDQHANPMGTLHGGVVADVADAAMGIACATLLELGESFTTVDLHVTYFRPVFEGRIEARATVVNASRRTAYLECDVIAVPEGKLVAKAISTCMILRGDQAKGR